MQPGTAMVVAFKEARPEAATATGVRIEVDEAQWLELRREAQYYRRCFVRAKAAKEQLQADNQQLRRQVREQRQRIKTLEADNEQLRSNQARLQRLVFGEKSERRQVVEGTASQHNKRRSSPQQKPPRRKPRRRDYSHLPMVDERIDLDTQARGCDQCGLPYVSNGYESSELIELQISALVRRLHRTRYQSVCQCKGLKRPVAPPVPRVFKHTRYGASVWALYLFQRFGLHQTVGNICRFTSAFELPLSGTTLVSQNHGFVKLFRTVYQALLEHLSGAEIIYGDETGWPLQHAGAGGGGQHQRAWLWMLGTAQVVCLHIDPHRSADAAQPLYRGFEQPRSPPVVLVCDRYSVYLKLADQFGLTLQHCWAHLRRDFIAVATGRDALQPWCDQWLDRIGALYQCNYERLEHFDETLPVNQQNTQFTACHQRLENLMDEFFSTARRELHNLTSECAQYQPLNSATTYQRQFSVFVQQPKVCLDNNFSERMIRDSVISRQLSFGSKGDIGAQLTAYMVSIIATLRLNDIRVYDWLLDYLNACAANGGQPPADLSAWLPWHMAPERRAQLKVGYNAQAP